jgi:hypothetical protein
MDRRRVARVLLAPALLWLALPTAARADLTLQTRGSGALAVGEASGDGGGSGLTPSPPSTVNLGAFNIQIVPGAGLSGNAPALAAFQRAANQWKAWITDPVTVVINADLAILGPGILGSTSTVNLQGSYPLISGRMMTDADDESDDAIVASLPASPIFDLPPGFTLRGATVPSQAIVLTKANARALGFTNLDAITGVAHDAIIQFSPNFSFDYDNSNGVGFGLIDFETVAAHEIGHALGFISDVDFVDVVLDQGGTSNFVQPTPLDLYRFANGTANDPATVADFATAHRSMVTNQVAIFDHIDMTFTVGPEVLMSTGFETGDGQQASHWKDNLGLGLMDPTLGAGELSPLSLADLRALDVIGWDISHIPEAGAWLLGVVATCLGGLGYVLQRLRPRKKRLL